MTQLPKRVRVAPDKWFKVIEAVPPYNKPGALGAFDPIAECIWITPNQSTIGKQIVLLHELIHAVEYNCRATGIWKRNLSEDVVENLAGGLFPMLALSGLWPGVSNRAVFYREGSRK